MGWLSKLLKGSASSSSTACPNDRNWSNSDSSAHVSDDDDDEKDELGGTDDDGANSGNLAISDSHWWEDEQHLELALRQGGRVEPNLHYDIANIFQPYQDPFFPFDNYRDIGHAPSHLKFPMDVLWQPEGIPGSANNEFTLASENNWPYQVVSYNKNHPLCDVCMQPIPVDSKGHIQMKEVHIWQQKYCTKHLHDGTPKCFTCGRLKPIGTKYSSLRDNRKICVDCQASNIGNLHECQPLIHEIHKFYEGLDMKIYQKEIPVVMLDQNQMKDRGHSRSTRGLTTTHESAVIHTIIQTPIFGPGDTIIGTDEELFKLVSYRKVEDILILYGCPRLRTGSVLAHEMMHAWLGLEGYSPRDKARGFVGEISEKTLREGFCQFMAYTWLDSEIRAISSREYGSSSGQLNFEKKLAQHIQYKIENHGDKVYRDGFWLVKRAVSKYSLKGTLDYIRMTGRFPK